MSPDPLSARQAAVPGRQIRPGGAAPLFYCPPSGPALSGTPLDGIQVGKSLSLTFPLIMMLTIIFIYAMTQSHAVSCSSPRLHRQAPCASGPGCAPAPRGAAGFRHIPTRRKPACPGESIPSGGSRYADTGFFLPNRWMRIVETFQQAIQLQGHGDMFFCFDNNYHISNNSSPR